MKQVERRRVAGAVAGGIRRLLPITPYNHWGKVGSNTCSTSSRGFQTYGTPWGGSSYLSRRITTTLINKVLLSATYLFAPRLHGLNGSSSHETQVLPSVITCYLHSEERHCRSVRDGSNGLPHGPSAGGICAGYPPSLPKLVTRVLPHPSPPEWVTRALARAVNLGSRALPHSVKKRRNRRGLTQLPQCSRGYPDTRMGYTPLLHVGAPHPTCKGRETHTLTYPPSRGGVRVVQPTLSWLL